VRQVQGIWALVGVTILVVSACTKAAAPTVAAEDTSKFSEEEAISSLRLHFQELSTNPDHVHYAGLSVTKLDAEINKNVGRSRGEMSGEYLGTGAWLITVHYSDASTGLVGSEVWWWFERDTPPRLRSESAPTSVTSS